MSDLTPTCTFPKYKLDDLEQPMLVVEDPSSQQPGPSVLSLLLAPDQLEILEKNSMHIKD